MVSEQFNARWLLEALFVMYLLALSISRRSDPKPKQQKVAPVSSAPPAQRRKSTLQTSLVATSSLSAVPANSDANGSKTSRPRQHQILPPEMPTGAMGLTPELSATIVFITFALEKEKQKVQWDNCVSQWWLRAHTCVQSNAGPAQFTCNGMSSVEQRFLKKSTRQYNTIQLALDCGVIRGLIYSQYHYI